MDSITSRICRFRIGALASVVLGTLICVANVSAAEPILGNAVGLSLPEQQVLFDSVVDSNVSYWNEKSKKEIEKIDREMRAKEDDVETGFTSSLKTRKTQTIRFLEDVIKNSDKSEAGALARLHLALLIQDDSKQKLKARRIIEEFLPEKNLATVSNALQKRLYLLAGDLAYRERSFGDAELHYKKVTELGGSDGEESTHAQLGLANIYFGQSKFEEASKKYVEALATIARSSGPALTSQSILIANIQARLVWSTFREGNYVAASKWAREYLRQPLRNKVTTNNLVQQEVIRVGAIAAYERNERSFFVEMSQDALAGDAGRDLVVESFEVYNRSGKSPEVDSLAAEVEKNFLQSRLLLKLVDLRARAAKKASDEVLHARVTLSSVLLLERDGQWRNRFELSHPEDEKRQSVVAANTEEAGLFFYRSAKNTALREDFAKCASLFRARIKEYVANENRGILFQRESECLYQAGSLTSAWESGQRSLKFALSSGEQKASYSLLANIARAASAGVMRRDDDRFRRYENAVDAFVAAFPRDFAAMSALFESAKRLDSMEAFPEARRRYERLLGLLSTSSDGVERELRENVLSALSSLNAKEKNISAAADSQSKLETYAGHATVSEKTFSTVLAANASTARNHALNLRREGKLSEGADYLLLWASRHSENPEAPWVAIEGIRAYAELQDWSRVQSEAERFVTLYSSHLLAYESHFWKAKALDANMRFRKASESYELSAYEDKSPLPLKDRILALKNAVRVREQFGEKDAAARLLQKTAVLEGRLQSERRESFDTRLRSAMLFRSAGNKYEAQAILASLVNSPQTPKNVRYEAEYEDTLLRLEDLSTKNVARRDLDGLIARVRREVLRERENARLLVLFKKAVARANSVDLGEFDALAAEVKVTESSLVRMATIVRRVTSRLGAFSWESPELLTMRKQLFKAHGEVARCYERLAHSAEVAKVSRSDELMILSENHKVESKKYAYAALEATQFGSVERLELSKDLNRHGGFEVSVEPIVPVNVPETSEVEGMRTVLLPKKEEKQ